MPSSARVRRGAGPPVCLHPNWLLRWLPPGRGFPFSALSHRGGGVGSPPRLRRGGGVCGIFIDSLTPSKCRKSNYKRPHLAPWGGGAGPNSGGKKRVLTGRVETVSLNARLLVTSDGEGKPVVGGRLLLRTGDPSGGGGKMRGPRPLWFLLEMRTFWTIFFQMECT